ncbi:MAG TPA: alpha-glucan family phosphorylase [Ilumatobacteraceae bacterium]|nr:alpha-glucan family phosphorylase [Ilumatobacteraceae bacterium]
MRPVRHFTVVSNVPESLRAMESLASNLHWAWDRQLARLFDRLDGTIDGRSWRDTGQHPVDLVRRTSPACWTMLAEDEQFVEQLDRAQQRLDEALDGSSWFSRRAADGDTSLESVAYFSPEFGITEAVPQYSGGLGVLAGDHLKASSDLGIPLVGVGLLYAEGYFHQLLDNDGWQRERNERIDPDALGLHPTGVEVIVDLADVPVTVRVWRADVGRIRLYLLDTNVPSNPPEAVAITDRLYGGDEQHRLRQEIILGIGGVRALRALDIHPQVFHTNEGHAGFLGLERIREWIDKGLGFDEAIEAVRAGSLFTTHTPVPAGIDRFPRELFEQYFTTFAADCGVTVDRLIAVGQSETEHDKFNMAIMGLRLAAYSNGVARLHGEVSRDMFGDLWPGLPTTEVPIGHVTNGVHARSWVSDRVDELLSQMIGDEWHLADEGDWERVRHLDHREIWDVRNEGRRELVDLVRERLGGSLLDPGVLTIGFARRFATYKRSTLLLEQLDRLRGLLLDADRPVQFVFAGKAHPADEPGKALIREIDRLTRDADVGHRFVFIPDYDIGIARTMYHGCDVWLNTPRRPMEACGTSGMKAALNGGLNCSIRDGWWDEMSDGNNGFDIASFDDDPDLDRRDHREANAAFEAIENEIVPLFYTRADDGLPHGWIEKIKTNWATLGWKVIAGRMVRDYVTTFYEPAAIGTNTMTADAGQPAKELAAWKHDVTSKWSAVRVTLLDEISGLDGGAAGTPVDVVAELETGALDRNAVVVQLLHGPLLADGSFDEGLLSVLPMVADDHGHFRSSFTPDRAGRWGVAARAMPTHPYLRGPFDTGLVTIG